MSITRALGTLTALAVLAGGCTHRNAATTDDASSKFCAFFVSINAQADKATSAPEGLAILKSQDPALQAQLASPPNDMQADIRVVLQATQKALQRNDLSEMSNDDVAQAGARLS